MFNLSGKRYLITGAAGFIGSHVAEELVKHGKEVVCIDNMSAGKPENIEGWWDRKLCSFVEMDVAPRHPEVLMPQFDGVDVVFHLAASKCTICRENPQKDLMVNAWGSFCVFEAAKHVGAKVVHVSTGSVNNGRPVSFYGVSKLAGEAYLRAFKEYYPEFRYAALRVYHVYGPRQDSSDKGGVIPIFIRQAHEGKPLTIHGDGDQVRHFTYVKDVVNTLFMLADDRRFDNHYLDFLNETETSIFHLAKKINDLMGKDPHRFTFQAAKQGDIKTFGVRSSLELPHARTTLDDGLEETISWYVNKFDRQKLKVVDGIQ